jgi:hypothetical protein
MFEKFKSFDDAYGRVITYCCRVFFAISLYAASQYLSANYVSKDYYDKTVSAAIVEKAHYADMQEAALKEISGKLDSLLLRDSANSQRFSDYDRRVSRLEDKIDKLKDP